MVGERVQQRILWLMDEIYPITQHSDLGVLPLGYDAEGDILYMDVMPRSGPKWAETAYQFAKQGGMKYDRDSGVYGIDGQPRVSYSGQVWARYVGNFLDGSRVAFNVWSQQPSHREAEEQLGRLYGLFKSNDGLEPIDVLRKFLR
jgi:hypothetical protein